jgi:hypothetical protein
MNRTILSDSQPIHFTVIPASSNFGGRIKKMRSLPRPQTFFAFSLFIACVKKPYSSATYPEGIEIPSA